MMSPEDPQRDISFIHRMASEAAATGNYTEALRFFDRAFADAGDDVERADVLSSRSQFLLEEMGRDSEALQVAAAALSMVEKAPPSAVVSMIRGVCRWVALAAQVEPDEEAIATAREALADFEIVIAADPAECAAPEFAADVAMIVGEFDKAIAFLTDLLQRDVVSERRPFVLARIAACHCQLGRLDEARQVALRGLAEFAGSHLPHLHLQLGYVQWYQGDYAQAAESLARALDRARDFGLLGRVVVIDGLVALIEILYADGRSELARQRLTEIVPLLKQIDARRGSEVVLRLCETLLGANELAQVESLCSEFLATLGVPTAREVSIRTYLHYVQSSRAYDRGDYAEAVRKLEPLLGQKLDPAWLEEWVLTLLGPSCLGVDNYRAAREVYARLSGWDDTDTAILRDARHKVKFIDARLSYDAGRFRQAGEELEALLRIPTIQGDFLAELHYDLGLCHEKLGELDAARGHYRAVLSIEDAGANRREWAASRDRALAGVRRHPLI